MDRLGAFLDDLAQLSRFYGVWIGQTNKRRLLPLHMREPGDECGRYAAETLKPWGPIPTTDARAANYGAFMGWDHDPIAPRPPDDPSAYLAKIVELQRAMRANSGQKAS